MKRLEWNLVWLSLTPYSSIMQTQLLAEATPRAEIFWRGLLSQFPQASKLSDASNNLVSAFIQPVKVREIQKRFQLKIEIIQTQTR